MNYLRLLSFLAIAVSIVSCKTNYRISVDEPAQVNLPDDVKVVGVINNIENGNKNSSTVIAQALDPEQIKGNKNAAERAVDGVINSLTNTTDMIGQSFSDDSMYLENGDLDWTYIDSIGKLQGIHAFVELNELRTVSPVGGTVLASASGQSSQTLEGVMFVNVHVVSTGQTFERWSLSRKYRIPVSQSNNPIDLIGSVQKKQEYYRRLGFNLGYEAGELIYTHRVWVNRMYFNKGSRSLKAAKHNMRQGNWDAAEKQLLHDVDNGNVKPW